MRIRRKSFVGIMTAAMLLLFTACSAAGNATQNAEPAAQAAGAGETAVEPAAQAAEQTAQATAQSTDTAAQPASAQATSAAAAEDQAPAEKNGDIMILYTSDIHCGADQGFGLVGLKQVRDTFEAQGYTTILVDDGDAVQGELMGTVTKGEAMIKLMNEMARRKERYGVATLCIGGGQGLAVLFELC